MILPNNTGGFMLQTMLYLANQQSNYSLNELYNLPPGVTPAGEHNNYSGQELRENQKNFPARSLNAI